MLNSPKKSTFQKIIFLIFSCIYLYYLRQCKKKVTLLIYPPTQDTNSLNFIFLKKLSEHVPISLRKTDTFPCGGVF